MRIVCVNMPGGILHERCRHCSRNRRWCRWCKSWECSRGMQRMPCCCDRASIDNERLVSVVKSRGAVSDQLKKQEFRAWKGDNLQNLHPRFKSGCRLQLKTVYIPELQVCMLFFLEVVLWQLFHNLSVIVYGLWNKGALMICLMSCRSVGVEFII